MFLFFKASTPAQNSAQFHIQYVSVAFPRGMGVKHPGREVDHRPLSCTEVRNEWSYTSISQHVFLTCIGVNFTFQCKMFCSRSSQRISGSVRTSPRLCNISPQPASPSSYAQLTPSFFSMVLST